MINTITSLLRNIWRKVKEMSAFYLALGTMFIPLAFILRIEEPDTSERVLFIIVIFGMLCMLFGMIDIFQQARQRKKEAMYLAMLIGGIAEKMGVNTKELFRVWQDVSKGKAKK